MFRNRNTECNPMYQLILTSRQPKHNLHTYACLSTYHSHLSTVNTLQPICCTNYWYVLYPITFVFKFYDICIILILTWVLNHFYTYHCNNKIFNVFIMFHNFYNLIFYNFGIHFTSVYHSMTISQQFCILQMTVWPSESFVQLHCLMMAQWGPKHVGVL